MATYSSVAQVWAANPHTAPTAQEAERGARRLWRRFMHRPWSGPVKITSGRNRTYVRDGVLRVNPDQRFWRGWEGIVHGLSHTILREQRPWDEPHSPWHLALEAEMATYVTGHDWHKGALASKPKADPKPEPDPRGAKIARLRERLAAWESKRQRAERAIAKISRSLAAYERASTRATSKERKIR